LQRIGWRGEPGAEAFDLGDGVEQIIAMQAVARRLTTDHLRAVPVRAPIAQPFNDVAHVPSSFSEVRPLRESARRSPRPVVSGHIPGFPSRPAPGPRIARPWPAPWSGGCVRKTH